MNDTPENKERRIIPRWFNSQVAKNNKETLSLLPRNNIPDGLPIILEKKELWDREKDIKNAVELATCAYALKLSKYAIDAANFLIGAKNEIFPEIYEIAEKILYSDKEGINDFSENDVLIKINTADIFAQIHTLKNYLSKYPYDSLTWADLSQAYIRLNQVSQAVQSINTALFISPNNRFILRAATRLFIHLREPDRANKLLLSRSITKFDPWLLSAEIATATVEGKTSRLLNIGREIIESKKFCPIHISELASAIGTVDCINGSIKNAKKMFKTSLIDPTENAVAQSTWAKRTINSIDNSLALNITPKIYEALVIIAYFEVDWHLLIKSAKNWLFDEPFSSRPAEMGSFAAADGLEDYELSVDFCRSGLIANPSDSTLLNNLAFALINLRKFDEAEKTINSVKKIHNLGSTEVAIKATEGFLHFRKGNFELGINNYNEAMKIAEKKYPIDYQNRVAIYYANEMFLNGLFSPTETITFAEPKTSSFNHPVTFWLYERLKEKINRH